VAHKPTGYQQPLFLEDVRCFDNRGDFAANLGSEVSDVKRFVPLYSGLKQMPENLNFKV